jgi:hypothetical protein
MSVYRYGAVRSCQTDEPISHLAVGRSCARVGASLRVLTVVKRVKSGTWLARIGIVPLS